MPPNQKKQQKALEKQKAKRKLKQQARHEATPASLSTVLQAAAKWPVSECLLSRDWQRSGEIIQILVARESPYGKLAAAAFVVDLGCLGVKNSMVKIFPTWADYKVELRENITNMQGIITAELGLVAKIIDEAIAYAATFHFKPPSDFNQAALLLEGADKEAFADVIVPKGRNGKPLFIPGPYDNVPLVLAKLEKAAGPNNFEYVPIASNPDLLPEEIS